MNDDPAASPARVRASRGVLLVAHGARDPRWALPFEEVAARVRASRPEARVQLAYLELMAPSIAEGGAMLAAAGCGTVDVLPLFLGAGGHVRKDLPRIVGDLAAAHPGIAWRLRPAVGEDERVVAAMAGAALEAIDAPAVE